MFSIHSKFSQVSFYFSSDSGLIIAWLSLLKYTFLIVPKLFAFMVLCFVSSEAFMKEMDIEKEDEALVTGTVACKLSDC